jgi:hypothetical protein
MQGPPGHRCGCGAAFGDYAALAEHVRRTIDCPRCEAPPCNLHDGDLFRWTCGHWIARDDRFAAVHDDHQKESP